MDESELRALFARGYPAIVRRVYLRVARLAFAQLSTYRAAMAGGIAANTAIAFLQASVFLAVFSARGEIRGLDAAGAVTFAFVTWALDAPIAMFMPLDLATRVRRGDVAVDLYRPFDVQLYWLANEAGRSAYATLTRLAPPLVIASLFFDLRVPTTPTVFAGFAASVVAAFAVSYAFRFLVALSGFWLLDGRGVQGMTGFLVVALSGFGFPLQLYPDWLGTVARALPFASLAQIPAEMFLGMHTGLAAVTIVVRQLLWAVGLAVAGRVVLARATRQLVVQGG